ncbi:MAG TPA: LptF/LptG family permease [Pyrinomonadaceae bacterium]|nr:LptF/LptG family permease [Pyrinomonadaceae bacterium]
MLRLNFNRSSFLIPKYIVWATIPYVLLSLLMLSAVLFAQQAARLAEILLYADLPFSVVAGIAATLLPGVLTFTIPLATLAGIVIGFSRMGTDSEIVAMRSAGVGTWTMLWPVLLLGALFTLPTIYIQLEEAPRAARQLEKVALQGALAKLDSPVEPRTFSTLPRYVIYVRDGDKAHGTWGRVFIYGQQADHSTQIFTARSGRIDSSGNQSELVLGDVLAAKFPAPDTTGEKSYVVERSDQLRISINTGREDIIRRLDERNNNADTMDWSELRERMHSTDAEDKSEAIRILNRRSALAMSPLVFSLLAGALGLRVRRGGRSVGVILSLIIVVVYYLISLLGESLARVGSVSPYVGPWLATAVIVGLAVFLLLKSRIRVFALHRREPRSKEESTKTSSQSHTSGARDWGIPNLMDATLLRTLVLSFIVGFVALAAIFNIFTLFELWRFIAVTHASAGLVARYLLFLMPLITVEIFPATTLIAVLVTYALLARRHEAIAWWACGQSVYRLMLPGLFFALAMAGCSWLVQEHVMPSSNLKQDALRARIRGGEARVITGTGRQWLASTDTHRFYSYEFDESQGTIAEPTVYELDSEAVHLNKVVSGNVGRWTSATTLAISDSETYTLSGMQVLHEAKPETTLAAVESRDVFKPTIDKPSQLSSDDLVSYVRAAKQRGSDVSGLTVALQKKYAAPFGVVIMAFIGMPLAVSYGRRGTIIALCAAIVVSIAYWAVAGGFQQLGNHGLLRPSVAGWSPLVIFAAVGTYFLSKVRT